MDALHRSVAGLDPAVKHTIGPSMRLANELLAAGERAEVAQYPSECAAHHWNIGGEKLPEWQAAVGAGKLPDFSVNATF